ncbi:MAG: electron transfer flavoprotein subunit beta/FixA family protein [Deltaproteobacteria bacterium]|nr:electron transfer flavoprotein subunit beta/FixA family protein [Deltaproteobacteria bacterium]
MDIVVCVKQVPEVKDVDLRINKEGTDINNRDDLVMTINEWDNYAVEEAVRLKDAHGGTVTLITIGDEDAEDVLRRGLAMGADHAILIDDEEFKGSDAQGIATGLYEVLKDLEFDLVLTGVQSFDDGWGQVGVILAELMNLPYATLVVGIDVQEKGLIIHRELESNTLEKVKLSQPALLTIQTGINTPRYVSIMGIRKVRNIEIEETDANELNLPVDQIGLEGSCISVRTLSLPPAGRAEMLTGSLDTVCETVADIIRKKGGIS